MNDTEFHTLVDTQLEWLEEQLDESDADIDYETTGGILSIEFANDSKVIINRQEPLHQLWLATRSGGYHFNYKDGDWVDDRSGQLFLDVLEKACSEQAQEAISFRD
ncbi:iron donor protein CyaY [Echinimonas agarilytica]|uniref:Iron-sulfur cluster assembly protein CyaY n=1 Tax=Echinimonas agarilytica TaxID=1215918 RepID=A0AA41W3R5_9GAMM|nr:iron donor protein CyaY [Echinimonas agarilytica]MCM2678255.1 iron donor protein CyaY [Echinimonas agarilytica]